MNKEQPIEAEVIPRTQALAVRPEQAVQPGLFGTTEPATIIAKATEVASALKDVISKQGLISNISGKQYPRCEAWTLLGTMLGVFPVCVWTKQVEGGWEARVEARTKDGCIIGAADAQCLRAEKNWHNRDDFAIRSMAQTRATAKCLRMPLGFVMTLAGYEATPAEEMIAEHIAPAPPVQKPKPKPAAKMPTGITRIWMIDQLNCLPGSEQEKMALEYFQKVKQLLPTEGLKDLPLRFVPYDKKELGALANCLSNFEAGGDAVRAFDPHGEADAPKEGVTPPKVNLPTEEEAGEDDALKEPWYNVIVTVPHKGQKRAEYLKNPDTIGSLYDARHDDEDARKRLWGFATNYEPKGWTKDNGQQMPPNASDIKFREALDQFVDWFEKNHPDEKL